MAQTVLTVVGYAIGSFLGPAGSSIGGQIGAVIGANVGSPLELPPEAVQAFAESSRRMPMETSATEAEPAP